MKRGAIVTPVNIFKRALRALTFEKTFEGYVAEEHPDGTFTIKDFPVFGEVAADTNGNKIAATPAWLRMSLDRGIQLQSEGFAGPVHAGHHGKWDALGQAKDERERIGALVLRDLRPHRVEGKVEQTIFADMTDIPAEKFARIQKGEFPHVSVEYIEEHRPAIDSLAMTGSACPFKRYPNMKIAKVVKAPKPACYTVVAPAPPAAAARFIDAGEEKKGPPDPEAKKDGPPAAESKPEDAGKPEGVAEEGQEDKVEAAPTWAVAMTNGIATLTAAMQAIAIKLGASMVPGSPGGPAVLPAGSTAPMLATAKPEEAPAMDAKTFGDLMGRVAVLEGKDKAVEKEKAIDLSVATFEAKVKGWPFDESDRKALRVTVATGGDLAAQAFIDQVKKRPKEMANSAANFRASTTDAPDSPAVMKFVQHGPVKLEQARRFSAVHAQLVAAGLNPSPEDKFIEHSFATEAARAAASKGDK